MEEPLHFVDRLARRLEQSGAADAQRATISTCGEIAWMIGDWTMDARILPTPNSPERLGQGTITITPDLDDGWLAIRMAFNGRRGQELAFLTYNPAAGEWVFVWLVTWRNSFTAFAPGWTGDSLVFTGVPTRFYGEPVHMRVILTRLGTSSFSLQYEEALPSGYWQPIDVYTFCRHSRVAP